MANKGGFSWKRLLGITKAKHKISKSIGIPITKSGRQRKVGKMATCGGCLLPVITIIFVMLLAITIVLAVI